MLWMDASRVGNSVPSRASTSRLSHKISHTALRMSAFRSTCRRRASWNCQTTGMHTQINNMSTTGAVAWLYVSAEESKEGRGGGGLALVWHGGFVVAGLGRPRRTSTTLSEDQTPLSSVSVWFFVAPARTVPLAFRSSKAASTAVTDARDSRGLRSTNESGPGGGSARPSRRGGGACAVAFPKACPSAACPEACVRASSVAPPPCAPFGAGGSPAASRATAVHGARNSKSSRHVREQQAARISPGIKACAVRVGERVPPARAPPRARGGAPGTRAPGLLPGGPSTSKTRTPRARARARSTWRRHGKRSRGEGGGGGGGGGDAAKARAAVYLRRARGLARGREIHERFELAWITL